MNETIKTALKDLGYKNINKFTACPTNFDGEYVVYENGEYFGTFREDKNCFVD